MTETELLRLYLPGQANGCLSTLYRRYYLRVLTRCVAMVRDADAARHHTQKIFLKAFGGLARLGHRARFETWLYSITYHYCVDQLERSKASGLVELTQPMGLTARHRHKGRVTSSTTQLETSAQTRRLDKKSSDRLIWSV